MTATIYLPAEERREILREYGKKYNLRIFIETGTSVGLTPWTLMNDFDHLFTIELSEDLWVNAVRMFRKYPHVECLLGDSGVLLPRILEQIDQPALVWLDGHYCGGDSARGRVSTPIRDELYALLMDTKRHVILIDDARVFDGGEEHGMYEHYMDYPSLKWVREVAETNGYSYTLEDDIIRLLPSEIDD